MTDRFTDNAQRALGAAYTAARKFGHTSVGSEHLLLGLLSRTDSIAAKLMQKHGITFDSFRDLIASKSGVGDETDENIDLSPRAKRILENSRAEAISTAQNYIGTEHILMAILHENDCVAVKLLLEQGVDLDELYAQTSTVACGFEPSGFTSATPKAQGKTEKNGKAGSPGRSRTPTLDSYGNDLTATARAGKLDPVIGRETEMERVIQILSRRTKNNPCLIGEPGVGKTAVAEGLALKISSGEVPDTIKTKRVVTLDLSGMLAGAKYRGEFEERIKNVMSEVKNAGDVILFIDEIHTLIGAGSAEGAIDAANILKPALSRGEIQVIGATTISEYRKYIEKDAALERRFQSVNVGEPSKEEAILILHGLRDKYEAHHKVKITDEAIEAAVELSSRYIADRFLPDKAIDLIDEAASKKRIGEITAPPDLREIEEEIKKLDAEKSEAVRAQEFEKAAEIRNREKELRTRLDEEKHTWEEKKRTSCPEIVSSDIAAVVTAWTSIPVEKLAGEESQRLLELDNILKGRVIGQDEAVSVIARAIRRGRTGLKDPKRPQGSFIFCGPTGVGKTELSKALAEAIFGDEGAIVRFDMSEYMEKHSVSKLIGSPPGYVGYDEAGQLTEKIRRKPYSVILFDEIEKAHPDVFNILLQILEDGILTDSHGRRVDFRNCVIIMTSNLGHSSEAEPKRLGFVTEEQSAAEHDRASARVQEALKNYFRPEFLNRIDEIVVFRKLSDADISKIAHLMLSEIKKRITALGIDIEFSDEVVSMLAKAGFDDRYGARPLRRAIQRRIEDTLSVELLEGKISSGDKVRAILSDGNIVYEKVQ
ncbi:MAG: ATP-dependent Clp protease ATP-binding subunit [Clostridia bacterium]|nr:ATP-dependent Clp protease ATP-binding subunit [Clostridia bacterium]